MRPSLTPISPRSTSGLVGRTTRTFLIRRSSAGSAIRPGIAPSAPRAVKARGTPRRVDSPRRAGYGWRALTMELTAAALADAVRAKRVSPVELVLECLARIERRNPVLRAFITVDADGALAAARSLEAEAVAGRFRGPLHGVPVAHKDLCVIPGLPTSCGTRTRDYFRSGVPCTAATRLAAAGAILLGKTNMTELAMGPFGDNAHHGDVQNPWKPGHAAGGSSSGSAAAVAAAHFFHDLPADVETAVRTAIGAVQALGVRVGGVKLPDVWTLTQECNVPIVSAEAATEHAPLLRERRDEVQPVVYARASA